jgi:hypothetical protein
MAVPQTPEDVLVFAKAAITAGHFISALHLARRMAERNVDMLDIHTAIDRSQEVEPYTDGKPRHGGTCWRIIGPDCDGDGMISIGIEVYKELNGTYWIALCTVM